MGEVGQDTFERLRQLDTQIIHDERVNSMSEQIMDVFVSVPDDAMYDEMLTRVVLPILNSKHGVFGYIDNNGDLVCPSMKGEIWDKCTMKSKGIVFPCSSWGGIWAESLINKKTVVANSGLNPPVGHFPVSRAICCALVFSGRLVGELLVANKESDYTQADADILEKMGRIIAPILQMRLQQDRVERELNYIKQRLAESSL